MLAILKNFLFKIKNNKSNDSVQTATLLGAFRTNDGLDITGTKLEIIKCNNNENALSKTCLFKTTLASDGKFRTKIPLLEKSNLLIMLSKAGYPVKQIEITLKPGTITDITSTI